MIITIKTVKIITRMKTILITNMYHDYYKNNINYCYNHNHNHNPHNNNNKINQFGVTCCCSCCIIVFIVGEYFYREDCLTSILRFIMCSLHQKNFCQTPFQLADPTQLQLNGVGIDFVFPWKEGRRERLSETGQVQKAQHFSGIKSF